MADDNEAVDHPEMPRLRREKTEWDALLQDTKTRTVTDEELRALAENVKRKVSRNDDALGLRSIETIPLEPLLARITLTAEHCRRTCANTKLLLERANMANCASLSALRKREKSFERELLQVAHFGDEQVAPYSMLKTFVRNAKQCPVCDDAVSKMASVRASSG